MKAMMSLYEGSKTNVNVLFEVSEEFSVAVGVHHESALSPLFFAIVVDVVTENATKKA